MARTDKAFEHLLLSLNLPFQLKHEQKQIIKGLLKGQDVLWVLPTGFGKSVCYGLVGQLMNKVGLYINE